MESKVDLDFVNFVKSKKHKDSDKDNDDEFLDDTLELEDFDFLCRKRKSFPFNDINPNKKQTVESDIKDKEKKKGSNILTAFLIKNKGRIVSEVQANSNKTNKNIIKISSSDIDEGSIDEDESENPNESSEDISDGKINHYTKNNFNNDDSDLEEALNEMKGKLEMKGGKHKEKNKGRKDRNDTNKEGKGKKLDGEIEGNTNNIKENNKGANKVSGKTLNWGKK